MANDKLAIADSDGRPIERGDLVLVLGKVERVYGGDDRLIEVTFEPWWPRWSAVLVKSARTLRVPTF
jgi:hypothetical protein